MLPTILSFLDVETTGLSSSFGRIIEVGIIRVENNHIVKEFSTLVNPDMHLSPVIQSITGITEEQLQSAPSFYDIHQDILDIVQDSVLVAHNVMFDYGFIRSEFKRIGKSFSLKYFCSVKLSKQLFPRFKHHNLDALIARHNITCIQRHRALDDARAICDFYHLSLAHCGTEKFSTAVSLVMKRPSLPVGLSESTINALPESPGVYLFYNKDGVCLYIGKSIQIKQRVLSHFTNSKNHTIDQKIAQEVASVEAIETAGELGALLLESTLIKKYTPLFNRLLRYASKLVVVKKIAKENAYHGVCIETMGQLSLADARTTLGIFTSKKQVTDYLFGLCRAYNLCPKLLGLEKTSGACFYSHLTMCRKACVNQESVLAYNLRFDEAFYKTKIKRWPFAGPIAITETVEKEEVIIVDQWCVLGSLKSASDSVTDLQSNYAFDVDTYKILSRYLAVKKGIHITSIPVSLTKGQHGKEEL